MPKIYSLMLTGVLILLAKWCIADQSDLARTEDSSTAFSGWLLVTDDQDWREKWNSPEDSVPSFSETSEVLLGEKITILTFYRNPQPDKHGKINLRCDLTITKPDGTLSYHQENMECANEKLKGEPQNLRLTYVIIDFIGEIGDPYGEWIIEVILQDRNSGMRIPLQTSFELRNTSQLTRLKEVKTELMIMGRCREHGRKQLDAAS